MSNSSTPAEGLTTPSVDRDEALRQAIDQQNLLLVRWLKTAHGLNNLILVLRSQFDGPADQPLNDMIDKSVAELRGVVNDSRAILTESFLGRIFAESSTEL